MRPTLLLALLLCAQATSALAADTRADAPAPIVVAHRGASGERPEHTASAYGLAIAAGADFIEPDLVVTKDGVLIARHENEIGGTTDVARHPEFAARKTTKSIDGQTVTGWFSEDFTLAEIKTLRARERMPQVRPANAGLDGQDPVLTFQEVIDLARSRGAAAGRAVGIYAELKHPTYFASIGLPMEARLVETLTGNGLARRDAPVFVECFEIGALRRVRALAPVRTIFLMSDEGGPFDLANVGDQRSYALLARPEGLREIAGFADGVGPAKALIVPRNKDGASLAPTAFVRDAHAAGLLVHPWTFRSENVYLPAELRKGAAGDRGDAAREYETFMRLGVDGVFTDFPAQAVAARAAYLSPPRP